MKFYFKLFVFISFILGQLIIAQTKINVLSYNIHHGEGTDGIVDLIRIADIIKNVDADFVALQEVDKGVERSFCIDIADSLAKLTGMYSSFFKNINFQGGEYGNAILSRHKILLDTNYHYKMLNNNEQRGLLVTKILYNADTLYFMNTHIDYRKEDAERLLNMAQLKEICLTLQNYPIIICGDFNDLPNSNTIKSISEYFTDVSTINKLLTFSSDKPEIKIDYIMVRDNDNNNLIQSKIRPISVKTIQSNASDHLPIFCELIFTKL
ncbi:MAG TPA: endonuclease/exonuclease/phosphatase family protein [Melioribacteraceae bacterium]|nr:endonuclease/exonuclease/phosphatase family protein [Melioribacteraceae bacterium]